MRPTVAAIAALTLLGAGSAPHGPAMADPRDLLRTAGGFGAAQLAAFDRGVAVARVLRTDRREIAVMGAVRIRGRRDRLLARYRDISNLRKSDLVQQAGTFGTVPSPADLAALSLEPYDLDAPEACVPGECAVRLSPQAMARFRREVDWASPAARQQSAAVWRSVLADIARGYVAGGDAALLPYANKTEPLSVSSELASVYDGFAPLASVAPHSFRYVREFPRARLDGTETLLYWSVADLGIRPVVGITHQAIYAPPSGPAIVALKRIYAAHYVDAGLGVTLAMDDGAGGFAMLVLERIRTRSLTSFTRAMVRAIVQDRTRDGVEAMLRGSKRALEAG